MTNLLSKPTSPAGFALHLSILMLVAHDFLPAAVGNRPSLHTGGLRWSIRAHWLVVAKRPSQIAASRGRYDMGPLLSIAWRFIMPYYLIKLGVSNGGLRDFCFRWYYCYRHWLRAVMCWVVTSIRSTTSNNPNLEKSCVFRRNLCGSGQLTVTALCPVLARPLCPGRQRSVARKTSALIPTWRKFLKDWNGPGIGVGIVVTITRFAKAYVSRD